MMLPRTLLLVVLLKVSLASVAESLPCYGFFGCGESDAAASTSVSRDDESGFKTTSEGCTPIVLELTTAGRPQDFSFDLVCNDESVWSYPSATIPYGDHGRVSVKTCVNLEEACCKFAVHDSHSVAGGDYEDMYLTVGDEDLLTYSSLENPPFTTLATSIGKKCGVSDSRDEYDANTESQDEEASGFKTPASCTSVTLDLTTDGRPEDITFDLVCNDAAVWTYPSALIPMEGAHGRVSVKACVFLEHACCKFAINDKHGDGLSDGDFAYLALNVDDEDILKYSSLENPPFTSLAKSFGNTCGATPQVNVTPKDQPQDVTCQTGKERPLNFRITLDEHPEDLSWFLVCNANHDVNGNSQMVTVWDTPRGSLAGHPGQVAQEAACIPYDTTCAFTIIDSEGDGLSQGSGYTLTLGVGLIDAYVKEPFYEKSYCIGELCGKSFEKATYDKEGNMLPEIDEDSSKVSRRCADVDLAEYSCRTGDGSKGALVCHMGSSACRSLQDLEKDDTCGCCQGDNSPGCSPESVWDEAKRQENILLEELKQDEEQREKELELLEEQEEKQQQQDPPMQEPPMSAWDDELDLSSSTDLTDQRDTPSLIKEVIHNKDDSSEGWLLAVLGVAGFILVLAAGLVYIMTSNRKSTAARVALSPMKNSTDISDEESTEPDYDDGTFVLDA